MKRSYSRHVCLAMAILTLLGLGWSAHGLCYTKCRFRFCDYHVSFTTGRGEPDVAFTRAICSWGSKHIGIVGKTGETRVIEGEKATPISQWHPAGLLKTFPDSFFKSFIIKSKGNVSGIGHETLHLNQKDFLNDRCFVVPIVQFVVLNEFGAEIDNEYPTDPLRDCVAFKSFSY